MRGRPCLPDVSPERTASPRRAAAIAVACLTLACSGDPNAPEPLLPALDVVADEDLTPPTLVDFSFHPSAISTVDDGGDVTVTLRATDDLSGVAASGGIGFVSPSGNQLVQAIAQEVGRSGDPEVVTFEGTARFPRFSEAGIWTVRWVPLSDRAGNFHNVDLSVTPFATELEVESVTDATPPRLLSFDFTPKSVDASEGPVTVALSFTAGDDLSGVAASGGVAFVSPTGGQLVQAIAEEVTRSGDPEVVAFRATATFPRFSEEGSWAVRWVPLSDRAGNFTNVDLRDTGFPTDLVVASRADLAPPTLLSFHFEPKSVNTASAPANVLVTLTAGDDLSGVAASGGVAFVSPSGGQLVQAIALEIDRSGDPEVVRFEGIAHFPRFSERGTWTVRSVPLSDRAGNFVSVDLRTGDFPTELDVEALITVVVDIRPGSDDNPVNLTAKGVLPVAVLTTDTFDAARIDTGAPVLLGGVPVRSQGPGARLTRDDVDGDGDLDLVAHFRIQDLVEAGALTDETTRLDLEARTVEGAVVRGSDVVRVVGRR